VTPILEASSEELLAAERARRSRIARRSERGDTGPSEAEAALTRRVLAERDEQIVAQAQAQAERELMLRVERERQYALDLAEAVQAFEPLREEWVTKLMELAELAPKVKRARRRYDDAWGRAENAGLPVPTRLAPLGLGEPTRVISDVSFHV
jgi:hypothetical protein